MMKRFLLLLCFNIFLTGCADYNEAEKVQIPESDFNLSSIPSYTGSPYTIVNDNRPYFTEAEITDKSFEKYSSLDSLGRCGIASACIGPDIMPTEKRGEIGHIRPSGWHTMNYHGVVEGNYLYNRCHLIAFELAAENDNEKNLITGTRYMNVQGMLPFENDVTAYIKQTSNHVMYRVTPVFFEDDLVARGILMEAYSVEDNGLGIQFCIFCYNVQPGVIIDYSNGNSELDEGISVTTDPIDTSLEQKDEQSTYILNTNTKKYHKPDCPSVHDIKEHNKEVFTGNDNELPSGYSPCKKCKP